MGLDAGGVHRWVTRLVVRGSVHASPIPTYSYKLHNTGAQGASGPTHHTPQRRTLGRRIAKRPDARDVDRSGCVVTCVEVLDAYSSSVITFTILSAVAVSGFVPSPINHGTCVSYLVDRY